MQNVFLVNSSELDIPSRYKIFKYDQKDNYSQRLIKCLESLNNYKYIFFDHEDMFLYKTPDYEEINSYLIQLFNDKYDYIRLIKSSNCKYKLVENYTTLFEINLNSKWIFSLQPSFWNRETLLNLLQKNANCSGWDLELKSQKVLKNLKINSAFSHREGKKRGLYHFDNNIYPYIATAVIKGKWNISEYSLELMALFKEYNIDPSLRGYI
tara:strand:- start:674 stop:1303 length:630 start_codon:yes stop_codon:yes gene_type:complete